MILGIIVILFMEQQLKPAVELFETMEQCQAAVDDIKAAPRHPEVRIVVAECRKI